MGRGIRPSFTSLTLFAVYIMRPRIFLIVIFFVVKLYLYILPSYSQDKYNTWQPVATKGIYGGVVMAIVVDTSNSNNIYIGLDGGGVYKSTDKGSTWFPILKGLTNHNISSLAIQYDKNFIYAGTEDGFYKKGLNGSAWEWVFVSNGQINDMKNLINKVTINYSSGLVDSRGASDGSVNKGHPQSIDNEFIDRASIANSLSSKLLSMYKTNRPIVEIYGIWLPSLDVGDTISIYDTNACLTNASYEIFRIREDIDSLTTKLYCLDLEGNEVWGPTRQKWGFVSTSDVANCGTLFTDYWHSGFARAV